MNNSVSFICSFFIFLFPFIGKRWFNRTILSSTVVSLGLLGTFSGIFFGLLTFDVNNIESALPHLLEGLKTAFLTSIAGMFSSLILRLYPNFYGVKVDSQPSKEENQIDQMVSLLARINENTNGSNSALASKMQSLNDILDSLNKNLYALNYEKSGKNSNEQFDLLFNHLQKTLSSLNQSTEKLGIYLSKSVNLTTNHEQQITSQMNNLGNLFKTTEEQLEKQITGMEARFKEEISTMEQFTKTLLMIVKKLSQDHSVMEKRKLEQQESDFNNIHN